MRCSGEILSRRSISCERSYSLVPPSSDQEGLEPQADHGDNRPSKSLRMFDPP